MHHTGQSATFRKVTAWVQIPVVALGFLLLRQSPNYHSVYAQHILHISKISGNGLDKPDSIPVGASVCIFVTTASTWHLETTRPHLQLVTGVMGLERGASHSCSSNTEVWNDWNFACTPTIHLRVFLSQLVNTATSSPADDVHH
jgi:hypothetical protein